MLLIVILLLCFLSVFSINPTKVEAAEEDLKISLLSSTNPTEEEIANYALDCYTRGFRKKDFYSYLEFFHCTNISNQTYATLYVGDLSVYQDEIYNDLLYSVNLYVPETLSFRKDAIYLVNDFCDGPIGLYGYASITYFLKAAYGINLSDYFDLYSFTCDTLGDGDLEYSDFSSAEQNILRIINTRFNSLIIDNHIEADGYMLFPKSDFTLHRLANMNLDELKIKTSWYRQDDPNGNKYYYNDFGFIITENIKNGKNYFITFNNPTFILNVNNLVSFDTIKAQISAFDKTEGDITNKIEFVDNTYILTDGKIKPGNYSFKAVVSDSYGNSSFKVFNINVYDNTPPVCSGNNTTISYKEKIESSNYKNYIVCSDNSDSNSELTFSIVSDSYSSAPSHKTFKAKCDDYEVVMRVTDTSGNYTDVSFIITVDDQIAPAISIGLPIVSETESPLSTDDIKALVTAIDEYDDNVTIRLDNLDSYGAKNEIKQYAFRAYATDTRGNESHIDFNVSLVDNDVPQINYSTYYLIIVDEREILTNESVLELLKNDVNLTNFNIISIQNDYLSSDKKEAGSYEVIITGIDLYTSKEKQIKAEIRVTEKEVEKEVKVKSNLEDFYENNKLFIIIMISLFSLAVIFIIILLIKNHSKSKKTV